MPQLVRQEQLRKPDDPDDQLTGGEVSNIETSAVDQEEFWNGVLSQLKRVFYGDGSGNWHDDLTTTFGSDAGLWRALFRQTPKSAVLTRDVNGRIEEVELVGDKIITISRDGDGRISSLTDTVYLWTMVRDVDGRIEEVQVTLV